MADVWSASGGGGGLVAVIVKSKVKVEIRETNDDAILLTCSSQTVRRGRKSV